MADYQIGGFTLDFMDSRIGTHLVVGDVVEVELLHNLVPKLWFVRGFHHHLQRRLYRRTHLHVEPCCNKRPHLHYVKLEMAPL